MLTWSSHLCETPSEKMQALPCCILSVEIFWQWVFTLSAGCLAWLALVLGMAVLGELDRLPGQEDAQETLSLAPFTLHHSLTPPASPVSCSFRRVRVRLLPSFGLVQGHGHGRWRRRHPAWYGQAPGGCAQPALGPPQLI